MGTRLWTGILATITLAGLTVGCEAGTSPQESAPFEANTALADYQALDAALSGDGVDGLRQLSGRLPLQTIPSAGSPATSPIISGLHRGATFVYDPTRDEYAVDPDRTGAPATGVRFILYELDGTGTPLPDQESGHADLVDEGDGSAEDIVLWMTVVQSGVTVLDYRTSLDENGPEGNLTVDGFLVGDNVRLVFSIDGAGVHEGARSEVNLSFDLRIDARDFQVTGSVAGREEGAESGGRIQVTAQHRDESFGVDVVGDDGIIDGIVELNGALFATVSGPEDDPTFLRASGDPLTGLEFLVLWRVIDSVEDVFDFVEDLIDPVDELVLLGAVL